MKDLLASACSFFHVCNHCPAVRPPQSGGFKVFTFKNPYLGNTCVPFLHWACSRKCAEAIEVPARREQLNSAKEQDRYKFVHNNLGLKVMAKKNSVQSAVSTAFPRSCMICH